jgi:hypothetical protein
LHKKKRPKNFDTVERAEDQAQGFSVIDGYAEFKTSGWTCSNDPSRMVPAIDTISKKTDDECLVLKAHESRESQPQTHNEPQQYSHTPRASILLPVQERLEKVERKELDKFYFSKAEEKYIIQWIIKYAAIRVVGHSEEFEELLTQLGFDSPQISDLNKDRLRRKTSQKLQSMERPLHKAGAIKKISKKAGHGKFQIVFEEWTSAWLEEGWDGKLVKPASHSAPNMGGHEEEREIFAVEE